MSSGGGGGTTTTVQKSDPPAYLQPLLSQAANEARRLYGTGVNAVTAPQYDSNAFEKAMKAWQGDGVVRYPTGMPVPVSDPNYDQYKAQQQRSAGAMPTLDQFKIPGTGGTAATNSLLAPAYYPGQTIANQSPETLRAQSMIANRALSGSPITANANNLLTSTLSGQFLNPANNPGFQQALNDTAKAYATGTAASTDAAAQANRSYGGSAYNELKGMQNKAFADSLNTLAGNLYSDERNKQMQAMLFAPQAANQDYADAQQLASVGAAKEGRAQDLINADINKYNYNSNLPLSSLQNYLGLLSGTNTGGTQTATQPYYSNSGAGALGGALGGAALAGAAQSAMPSLFQGAVGALGPQIPGALSFLGGPAGLLGGAVLGGLLGRL